MKQDATAVITQQFIDAIEGGMLEGKWVRPWQNTGDGFPTNALTGRPYSGTNAFMLLIAGGGQWATYKQWQELGAQVRKGEKSTKILRPIIKKDPAQIKEDMLIGFSAASVFSATQVDNYNAPSIEPKTFEDSAEAEAFIVATGAELMHSQDGSRGAFYVPSADYINMPAKELFTSEQDYYSTLLHELSHWSGHESRLDRGLNTSRFGEEAYAFEELVAELSSTFLCAHLGIHQGYQDNHAKYLKSWLKVLKSDTKALMTAASQAEKAYKHLRQYSEEVVAVAEVA
jgi:antirestriction protein ArdC